MAKPADQVKINMDEAGDDPKQARGDLADNVDKFNQLKADLGNAWDLDIGDGLEDDGGGNLQIKFAANPGLEFQTTQLRVKRAANSGIVLTAGGVEVDINGTTLQTVIDYAADFLLMWDTAPGQRRRIALTDIVDRASQAEAEAGTDNVKTMTALRVLQSINDNPQAPPANSVGLTQMQDNAIGQAEMLDSAIGQAELKSTTGTISTTAIHALITGPGGQYGFWPEINSNTGPARGYICAPFSTMEADASAGGVGNVSIGTSFLNRFTIGATQNALITARQRYIQASPPYDLGDGEVRSFIFAMVDDATGLIEAKYHAPDPPWANNGPTNIHPDRIDKKTRKGYKTVRTFGTDLSKMMDNDFMNQSEEIEVTNEFKNSDMNLIPHPFQGNDLTGKSIVLIDPMSDIVGRMEELKNCGCEDDLLRDYCTIGNEDLPRGKPPGVMCVSVKMK